MKYIAFCKGKGFGVTRAPEGNGDTVKMRFNKETVEACPISSVTVLSQLFVEYVCKEVFLQDFDEREQASAIRMLNKSRVSGVWLTQQQRKELSAEIVYRHVNYEVSLGFNGELFWRGRCRGDVLMVFLYKLKDVFCGLLEIGENEDTGTAEASKSDNATKSFDEQIEGLVRAKGWDLYPLCREIVDRVRTYEPEALVDVLDQVCKHFVDRPKKLLDIVSGFVFGDVLQPNALPPVISKWVDGLRIADVIYSAEQLYYQVFQCRTDAKSRRARLLYAFFNHFSRLVFLEMGEYGRLSGELALIEPTAKDLVADGRPGLLYDLCLYLHDHHMDDDVRAELSKAMLLIPDSRYLVQYYATPKILSSSYDQTPCTDEECAQVDLKQLYRYFTLKYNVIESGRRALLSCNISIKTSYNSNKVMSFYVDMAGKIIVQQNSIENRKYSPIAHAVYQDLMESNGEKISAQMIEIDERLRAEELKRRTEMLNFSMDQLMLVQPKTEIRLEEKALADIEFSAEHSLGWNGRDEWHISAKIGSKRMYVVRNMVQMINMFRAEETFAYGKEFSFTHMIENLVHEKREAVKWLMLCADPNEIGSNVKVLTINSAMFGTFLEKMKGNQMSIEGDRYLLRLEERKPTVSLDRKAVLQLSPPITEDDLMSVGSEMFLIDQKEMIVDRIVGTAEQKMLYRFAVKNAGADIEPVFERFYDEVYSRFYEDIRVADELKDRMHLSEIVINAYFDFERSTITVRSEVNRDGNQVDPEQMTAVIDRSRYAGYTRCLEAMGFKDGVLKDEGRVLTFLSMEMGGLKKYCNVFLSESILNKKLQNLTPPMLRIDRESTVMKAFLENSEYSDEELKKIMKAIRTKKKFILLTGDRVIDLSGEEAQQLQSTVADVGLNEDHLSVPQQISTVQALRAFAHERNCRIDQYLYDMIGDIRNFKNSEIEIPEIKAQLRPYQAEGFCWLRTLSDYGVGGILADDMGLGKTLQFISLLKSDPAPGPDLVVCPKSLVFNWVNEFKRFAPDMDVVEIYGQPEQRRKIAAAIDPKGKTVYVTSYDSLRNDLESYQCDFRYLVLDEAQYIKNVNAQKSRTVKMLTAQHRFALTGTPIENSVLDLWSIFDFIMPGYFDEIHTFKSEYTRNGAFANVIAKRIAPFVLRRTKRDVLKDLPDKYERIHTVEMKAEQRKVYDAFKLTAVEQLNAGANAFDVLPYLMRLRQICDDPALFVDGYKGGSGKMDEAAALITGALAEGHRLLVFSQFVQALDRLKGMLRKEGIPYYTITGETSAKDRIDRMNAFNAGGDVNVFLISLKAGGTGLNLTGADMVIHLDPWWNVAAEDQASDRAHRIGQTRNVEVIKLICEDSVEQRVIELQNMKKDIIDKLISDNDSSVTAITAEDISFILQ